MSRPYDLVVFGASGFTGKFVVEEIVKTLQETTEKFTWAVAGRSASKLDQILKEVSDFIGTDVTNTPKLVADVSDIQSLHDMAKLSSCVVNCVGPYRFYGEVVVKACLAEGAHHVDLSAERTYLAKMQLLCHKEAEEKGVYIVGSCGFDSIPADCGTVFLEQKFNGDLNTVEEFIGLDTTGNSSGNKGATLHFGTWQSIIHGLANARAVRPLLEQLFPEPLPKPRYKISKRGVIHFNDILQRWCLPFPGSDDFVMERTQRYYYDQNKKRPVQVHAYVQMQKLFTAILVLIICAGFFALLTQCGCGRYLLEKYPRFFSFGVVSHEGPTREAADALNFTVTLVGEGWKEKLANGVDEHTEKPDKRLIVKVRGKNPGYGSTCKCIIQSALTILRDGNAMPSTGGVYTPGVAFANTNLISRLNKTGVTFMVEE